MRQNIIKTALLFWLFFPSATAMSEVTETMSFSLFEEDKYDEKQDWANDNVLRAGGKMGDGNANKVESSPVGDALPVMLVWLLGYGCFIAFRRAFIIPPNSPDPSSGN